MSKRLPLTRFIALVLISQLSTFCNPNSLLKEADISQESVLQGRWQFDSIRITFYDTENSNLVTKASMKEVPKKAWLTIGFNSWNYSGSVLGNWTYKRKADSLEISMDAYSMHGSISELSTHFLSIKTKTQEPDEYAGYSVSKYYFSR